MEWHITDSCGNSPKNQMLVDWVYNFLEGNDCDDFINKDSVIQYRGETSALTHFDIPENISELYLETSITHGKDGSVLAKAVVNGLTYPFGLFFKFSMGKQPKINQVTCIVDRG